MKIKKLFSFSSQKSSKSCDSLETILRQPQQQVGSSSGGSGIRGEVKGDIHSEYVINEMLGKGGFGRVFSARRICDGTEVAVKEVVKDARYKTDNKNSNSLPTEIALMQQVQHVEGVIKILDCFDSPDCYYIVMEKFKSKDLFDFITDQGPLPEKLARSMFRGIVKTVIECRDGGVLHRDIKDENILVDLNTMNTKLIDFGSGCVLNKTSNNSSSSAVFTEYRGTRVYSPPEWIQQGRYTGDGLTVWSLGVLLYDMLCGDIPFTCDRDTCAGKLTWNRHLRLSDAAMDLVERCLTVLPEQRITLDSILSHPWLQEFTPSLRASPSSVSLMSTSPVSSVTSSSSSPVLSDSLLEEVVASLQPASASLLVMTV